MSCKCCVAVSSTKKKIKIKRKKIKKIVIFESKIHHDCFCFRVRSDNMSLKKKRNDKKLKKIDHCAANATCSRYG